MRFYGLRQYFSLFIDGEIKKKHKVNEEKCIGCEVCVNKCPVKAIEMKILIEKE